MGFLLGGSVLHPGTGGAFAVKPNTGAEIMSLGVLNNIANLYAQNNLNQTQDSLQKVLTQLSSGSRINSGADDAAGLAIANGLNANIAALSQSTQNVNSGVGLLQTADGALSQVTNLLNRAVTLSTEAANGSLTSGQVGSANQEYQNILTEIGNIGSATNFNGISVFSNTATTTFVSDGTSSGSLSYADEVGALTKGSVGQTAAAPTVASAALTAVSAAPTASAAATLTYTPTGGTGTTDTLSASSLTFTYAGGTATSVAITAGSTLAQAASAITTAGGANFSAAVVSGKLVVTGGAVGTTNTLTQGGTLTDANSTPAPAGTAPGAGIDFTQASISTLTASTAATVLTSATSAIADVAYQRGVLGANINELTAASGVVSSEQVNLTSAENNVTATNYAQAASDLSKYQVLSQTGISAIAQANTVQQEVLKLLQ